MPRLRESDYSWIEQNCPNLVLSEGKKQTTLQGSYSFALKHRGHRISDSYAIEVRIPAANNALPVVREVGGRLKGVANEQNTKTIHLHMNDDESLCLAAPQQLRLVYAPDPSIKRLFEEYIDPFLYSQSYFESSSGKWPWKHLPHYATGIIVWYNYNHDIPNALEETVAEVLRLAKDGRDKAAVEIMERANQYEAFNPRSNCLCGLTNKKYTKCHPALVRLALPLRLASEAL